MDGCVCAYGAGTPSAVYPTILKIQTTLYNRKTIFIVSAYWPVWVWKTFNGTYGHAYILGIVKWI